MLQDPHDYEVYSEKSSTDTRAPRRQIAIIGISGTLLQMSIPTYTGGYKLNTYWCSDRARTPTLADKVSAPPPQLTDQVIGITILPLRQPMVS